MKLGSTIKMVRNSTRLTQRAAAQTLGISSVHLCNLEHDKVRPSAGLFKKMNMLWGVDIYVLAWCLHGDLRVIPDAFRRSIKRLGLAWKHSMEA